MNLRLVLYVALFGISSCSEAEVKLPKGSNLKLVIDQDGGADDAIAVVMCILYEKYFNGMQVVALTTTHGNVNEEQVFKNSQRFLDLVGRRDIPIYRGATRALLVSVESDHFFGYDGLGDNKNNTEVETIEAQEQHAANGLIELSKKYEGELVVMAIGPQTNIALAQRLDPGFFGRLAQLYVGAGNIPSSEPTPTVEFNAEMDVEAYRIVTDSAIVDKVTLIPFSQIKVYLNITKVSYNFFRIPSSDPELKKMGPRLKNVLSNKKKWRKKILGSIDTPTIHALNCFERVSLAMPGKKWKLLDPAVAAIVLDQNSVAEFKLANNGIHVCGAERGINTNSFETSPKDANVRIDYTFAQEAYMKLLIDIFSAELNQLI